MLKNNKFLVVLRFCTANKVIDFVGCRRFHLQVKLLSAATVNSWLSWHVGKIAVKVLKLQRSLWVSSHNKTILVTAHKVV